MSKYAKWYVAFSSFVIIVIGLSYGLVPERSMKLLYGIAVSELNLIHILRAVMGLYIMQAVYWLINAYQGNVKRALSSQFVFLIGLIIGRFISLLFDGIPSIMLLFYLFGEIFFVMICVLMLRKLDNNTGRIVQK